MDETYRVLLREVRRQLRCRSEPCDDHQSANNYGIIRPQQLGESYHNELVQLQQILSDPSVGSQDTPLRDLQPTLQTCIWALPAFCRDPFAILDPIYVKGRLLDLQETCGFTNRELYTDDIWESQQLHDWAKGEQPSLLLVQGSSESINRTERFSAEICDFIREKQPIVSVLDSPPSTDFIAGSEVELLRQLAIQALQKVSVHNSIGFLAHTILRFMEASTREDWFDVLEWILEMTPSLFLVVDVSVLGERRVENARTWPVCFEKIMTRIRTTSTTCLRILLISTFPIWSDFDSPNLLSVDETPELDMDDEMTGIEEEPSQRNLPIYLPTRDRNMLSITELNQPIKTDQVQDDSPRRQREETNPEASQPDNPPSFQSVDIAILCALPLEADAVKALFDVPFTGRYCRAERDTNTYSLGVIGRHSVVLVHMPRMGTRTAAAAAARCEVTFPKISLVLVVGICGGVPFLKDGTELMLGDVAISEGLVTYDFGRQYPDKFVRKDSILESARKPPDEILGFLAKLKSLEAKRLFHERATTHMETLRRVLGTSAIYPGADKDVLFEPEYRHKHQDSACTVCATAEGPMGMICENARTSSCKDLKCDSERSISRLRQQKMQSTPGPQMSFCPTMHVGVFASGDKVMKSGEGRDEIARNEGIIAFEMEGAGVWDTMPCVIIKGVCDYADSHKDKRWQEFAAATAAACMRAFLEGWRQ